MTRRMLLVRHGDPRLPAEGKVFLGSRSDVPLAPEGISRMERLREHLENFPLDRIVTSPLRRARESATLLAEGRSLAVEVDPALREIDLGEWDGLPFATVRARDPEGFAERGRRLADFRPPGGESFRDLAARVAPHLTHLLATSSGNLLLVAHAGVFHAMICTLLNLPLERLFLLTQSYGGVHLLDDLRGEWRVKRLNWSPEL